MRLLYIGVRINHITSGADQVNKRNQQLLMRIFHNQITYVEPIEGGVVNKIVFGVNREIKNVVKNELGKGIYSHVFIAQSLLGRIAKVVKQHAPSVEVITFFHNIEVQYAQEYLRTRGVKALPFCLAVKWWERIACQFTDIFITLNKRDSFLLKKVYGKEATIELPTSFHDRFDIQEAMVATRNEEDSPIDYLFVGVAFFANLQGVQWFIDNVMPKVKGEFYIVGKGMDKVAFNNLTPNIHIYGFVDDLAGFYYRARIVISPIFVGGGMKTKTAEALMFGKTIVGTTEAFEGYEIDNRCMYKCSTPEDFIQAIFSLQGCRTLNQHSRNLFKKYYSTDAAFSILKNIFYE